MTSLTIRNLDEDVKTRLRVRAAEHGRSMEEEARRVLAQSVLSRPVGPSEHPGEAIRRRFAMFGGVELDIPPREIGREPPDFD